MRVSFVFAAVSLLFSGQVAGSATENNEERRLQDDDPVVNKGIVREFVEALFNEFDADKVDSLLGPDYIQHNPFVATGRDAPLGFVPALEAEGAVTKHHRYLADGDLVAVHSTYSNAADLFGGDPLVAFDIFRLEDGLVNEHWDNLQQPPAKRNLSGRTMTNGPKNPKARASKVIEANKQLVSTFLTRAFIEGDFSAIPEFISSERYRNHSPGVADGIQGIQDAAAASGSVIIYTEIKFLIGDGNFVLAATEGTFDGVSTAFYDMFKLKKKKIVEHWDVIQAIPPADQFAHDNGKWGFDGLYET